MARDIVEAFAEALRHEGLPADLAARVAGRLRSEWGGERVYVQKRDPDERPEGKVLRLAAAIAAGVPLRQAFDACGVSRSAGYRWISRRLR